MTARTQLTLASGSKPAMMIPAPNATPAMDPVTPNHLSNGSKPAPMRVSPEPATSRTPTKNIRSLRARGFHFDTSSTPSFGPRLVNRTVNRRSFHANLYLVCAFLARLLTRLARHRAILDAV